MLGRILVGIAGLMVVALSVALLVPYFIDWTDFRKDFEVQASRIIGKKVVVHGKVDARLLPFPSVTLADVRVGEDKDGEPLIRVETFSLDAELAPLLSGQVHIYNMHLERPQLRLKLNADGTLDWVKTGKPLIPALSVILEQVDITDGDILFKDEQTGRTRHVAALNATLSAKTLAGPWHIEGTGTLDGEKGSYSFAASKPDDKGAVSLKSQISPIRYPVAVELDGTINITDLRPRYAGRFNVAHRLIDDGPRLSGDFELGNDRIGIPAYELKLGNPDDPYLVTGKAMLDHSKFLLKADGQQIDMTRLEKPGKTTGSKPSAQSQWQAIVALAKDIPIPQVPGRVEIALPAIIASDTTLRDIELVMRPKGAAWAIDKASAILPGRTTFEAKGELKLDGGRSFIGELLLASSQPSGFAEWVTGSVAPSIRGLKTAGFSASVNLTPEVQILDNLEIVMGEASLKGRIERIAVVNMVPELTVDLTGNSLDLDRITGLAGLITGDASPQAILSNAISAKLKIGRFSAFGVVTKDLATAFSVRDGSVAIKQLTIGDLAGVSLTAKAALSGDGDKRRGEADLTIKSADPSAFLALLVARLPAHPVLARLAANAAYFADSDLGLNVKIGSGDWPVEVNLDGVANGTTLSAHYVAQTLALGNTGGMMADLTLENTNIPTLFGQAGFATLPFDVGENGVLNIKISEAPLSEPQASVNFTSDSTTFTLEGQTNLTASQFLEGSYQLNLQSDDIEPYLLMGGIGMPQMGTGLPVSFAATMYVTAEAVALEDLSGTADKNEISGNLSASRGTPSQGTSPRPLEGALHLDSLDMAWLAESIYGPPFDASTGQLSSAKFSVPTDTGYDSRIKVSATRLTIGDLPPVTLTNAILIHQNGELKLNDITGQMATGRLSGRLELANIAVESGGGGLLRARLDLADADLSTLIKSERVKGRVDVGLIIETLGKTAASLPKNANGSGSVTLRYLMVNGVNSSLLPGIIARSEGMEISEAAILPLVERALMDGALTIDAVKAPFTIAGGILRAQNIASINDEVALAANVDVNFQDDKLDGALKIRFKTDSPVAGADPAITLSWQGLPHDPGKSVDVTELANFLSLRKFELERKRVDILQASLIEQQRLRREASFYRMREQQRKATQERIQAGQRLLKQAQVILQKQARQEEALRQKRQVERRPDNSVTQGEDLAPPL